MRLAVDIQRGRLRVVAKADCATLMRYSRQRDGAIQEEFIGENMVIAIADLVVAVNLVQDILEFLDKLFVRFTIGDFVIKRNFAVTVERYAVVRMRQVFTRQPEINGMFGDPVIGEARSGRSDFRFQQIVSRFAQHLDMSHRIAPFIVA